MKHRIAVVVILALIVPQVLPAFDENDAKERVKQIKAWLPTFEYAWGYKIDSEAALEKAILFIEDSIINFHLSSGMDMSEFWRNASLYERFMYETKKTKGGWYFCERLIEVTREMNGERVSVLTFLVLNDSSSCVIHLLKSTSIRNDSAGEAGGPDAMNFPIEKLFKKPPTPA